MNYENFISYRYIRAKKGGFISFLNFVAISGVAVGVMALIVVTGIMTGFGNNLREKIIGTTPHVIIEKETAVKDFEHLRGELMQIDGVAAAAPYIQGNIFLENGKQATAKVIRGIDPVAEQDVTKIKKYLTDGEIEDLQGDTIFIGSELARYYGYTVGDPIVLIVPGSGIEGRGWRYNLVVTGIFNTGMADYDLSLLVVNLNKAREMFGLEEDSVSGIGVRLSDPYQASDVKLRIGKTIGFSYLVQTWIDTNKNLFHALFLEKLGMFLVLSLMVIVAAFNIASALIVTVMSKIHDIGIMKSFGVPRRSIRNIFMKQGSFIGLTGVVLGLLLGFGVSYILRTYVPVPEEIYAIDRVPVELQLHDILLIVSTALIIVYLSTIYPAIKGANLQPVEALRYE